MTPSLRVSGLVLVAASWTSTGLALPVSADQAFHTQRFPLAAVAGARR
jgi:hypothetical protein